MISSRTDPPSSIFSAVSEECSPAVLLTPPSSLLISSSAVFRLVHHSRIFYSSFTRVEERELIDRFQVNPEKYKGIVSGFRTTIAEEGARALVKGWAPTAIGYSLQGLGKFGFYELFKNVYADAIGEVRVTLYRSLPVHIRTI